MDVQTLQKEVRHRFSADEIRDLGEQMAQAVARLENLEDEFQEVKAGFKEKMAGAQKTIKACAAKIRQGFEMRLMECRMERDFAGNAVRLYRQDTGEMVEERAMTIEERQRSLGIAEPPSQAAH
jgi:uncharacterized coiled-coil DUF342 family protein